MPELEQQLQQIIAEVEKLREGSTDGPATRKLVDSIFRRVHTLKAAASAEGASELVRVAHEFENILHELQTGRTALSDGVRQLLDGHSNALSQILVVERPLWIPADIWVSLTEEEKHRLSQAVREGARLFRVQTRFDVSDFDRQFQNLKEILTATGEVISVAPKIDEESDGKIDFRIIYARVVDPAQLRTDLSTIPDVLFEEILPANIFQQALRAGQATALATGKEVDFVLHGEDVTLDESLAGVLLHLVRNAVDHGIESRDERITLGKNPRGTISIEASAVNDQILIAVTDDGRGIDPSITDTQLLFRQGFSTAAEVSEISGRGVGLDVVKTAVEALGGAITVRSVLGQGSTFEITVPCEML